MSQMNRIMVTVTLSKKGTEGLKNNPSVPFIRPLYTSPLYVPFIYRAD
jgi:hypothetical protein